MIRFSQDYFFYHLLQFVVLFQWHRWIWLFWWEVLICTLQPCTPYCHLCRHSFSLFLTLEFLLWTTITHINVEVLYHFWRDAVVVHRSVSMCPWSCNSFIRVTQYSTGCLECLKWPSDQVIKWHTNKAPEWQEL